MLVLCGWTIGAGGAETPLHADFAHGYGCDAVKVVLIKPYRLRNDTDMPTRPSLTGGETPQGSSMLLPAGFNLGTFAPEAAALVAANAAVYA